MNIFLTGGTGFIGSHFINKAHEFGHTIYAIRRKNSNPRIPLKKQPNWITGDLDDQFGEYFKKCKVLVHLAAHSANVPYDNIENCLYWNVTASLKLFNQAYNNRIKNYLVAGSCFEYGLSGSAYKYIPPDAPLKPTMTYPASKAASSIIFNTWAIMNRLKLKYYRIFQVFGEGELETRFWPSLKKAALSGKDYRMTKGEQIRDFINVSKVVSKLIEELEFENVDKGNPLFENIGTGKPQTLKQFANYWWDQWKAQGKLVIGAIPYRENEVMRYVPLIN